MRSLSTKRFLEILAKCVCTTIRRADRTEGRSVPRRRVTTGVNAPVSTRTTSQLRGVLVLGEDVERFRIASCAAVMKSSPREGRGSIADGLDDAQRERGVG